MGKLLRKLLAVQASEAKALRQLEEERHDRRLEAAKVLKLERTLDRRNETLRRVRADFRSSTAHLRQRLQALRQQWAGAVTLDEQEKFSRELESVHETKRTVEAELQKITSERSKAEDRLHELLLKHEEPVSYTHLTLPTKA